MWFAMFLVIICFAHHPTLEHLLGVGLLSEINIPRVSWLVDCWKGVGSWILGWEITDDLLFSILYISFYCSDAHSLLILYQLEANIDHKNVKLYFCAPNSSLLLPVHLDLPILCSILRVMIMYHSFPYLMASRMDGAVLI